MAWKNLPVQGGGGGGAVDSVFGRTGAVAAVAGDYDAGEIDVTGTYANAPSAPTDLETVLSEYNSAITAAAAAASAYIIVPAPATNVEIQAAVDQAVAAGGGTVQLLAGQYDCAALVLPVAGSDNIIIQGVGAGTIVNHDGAFNGEVFRMGGFSDGPMQSKSISTISAGATSVTCTTVADAGAFLAGDRLYIRGTDSDGLSDVVYTEVLANGNPGTGVITLKYPVSKALTSPLINAVRGGRNCYVKDMTIRHVTSDTTDSLAVQFIGALGGGISNIFCEDFGPAPSNITASTLRVDSFSSDVVISDCFIDGCKNTAIAISSSYNCEIKNCIVYNAALSLNAADCAIAIYSNTIGAVVENNHVFASKADGISILGQSGIYARRTIISKNLIENCLTYGTRNQLGSETVITENVYDYCLGVYAILLTHNNNKVADNVFKNCTRGLTSSGSTGNLISNNKFVGVPSEAIVMQAASSGCAITGNSIFGTGASSSKIQLSVCTDCIVSDNTMVNSFGFTMDDSDRNIVSNNMFKTVGATAINLDANCDFNIVTGNMLIGSVIANAGTYNKFTDNSPQPPVPAAKVANYTTKGEPFLKVNTSGGAVDITISATDVADARYKLTVKDSAGSAGTNNITIKAASGTIDGVAGATGIPITVNYGVIRIETDGTNSFSL